MNIILTITGVLFFITTGFLFAGGEMALISLNKYRVSKKAASGDKKFQALKHIIDDPISMINSLLIGINLSIVAGSILIHSVLERFIHHNAALWALFISSFTYLLIAELMPKTLFHRAPIKMALNLLPFLKTSFYLFRPFEKYFSLLVKRTIRKSPERAAKLSLQELTDLLQLASNEGTVNAMENKLILQTFNLSMSKASDIMVPLENVDSISDCASVEDTVKKFKETERSRLLVTSKEDTRKVAGIITIYDLLFSEEKLTNINDVMRPPVFIKEHLTCDRVLHLLHSHKSPFLVVRDQKDSNISIGIVTASDLINNLFGEKLF